MSGSVRTSIATMELLAGGRDADVFSHGHGLVLRRYRDGRSVEAEGTLMRELAALGYPVPAVESAEGADLVMERVEGPTMAVQLLQGALDPAQGGGLLARLHDDLHALPWTDGRVLLHLDLHPLNVLMSSRGPVVIDWSNARPGPAGLDVAMTALILAQVVTFPEIVTGEPGLAAAIRDDGGTTLTDTFTAFLAAFVAGTETPFAAHLDAVAALRRADRYQTAPELARLGDAVDLVRSLT